jgi:predicted lipoprotein with Yx(FWY)xxD motif
MDRWIMKKFQFWGVGGVVAAAAIALVIVPSSIGSSADAEVGQLASAGSRAQVSAADPDDPESVEKPAPAVVGIVTASSGRKLTDGAGRALYVFSVDPPGKSSCVGACARTWLPARSLGGKPQPGTDVGAASIGNIQRPDGSEQITYNGHPVYYYSGDGSPGQSNGNGRSEFGGSWSAQPPAWAGEPK